MLSSIFYHNMDTFQFANGVKDKNDFIQFLKLLLDDLVNKPEKWENTRLDHYIESMAAYLEVLQKRRSTIIILHLLGDYSLK